jgi:hypothetical protein
MTTSQQLRAAVEGLFPHRQKNGLPPLPAEELDGLVRHLLVEGGEWTRGSAAPRSKPATAAATKKELDRVAKAAEALRLALDEMRGPAASVFRDVAGLVRRIQAIETIALHAEPREMPDDKPQEALDPTERLALAAAHVFLAVSDDKPTRRTKIEQKAYGPFLDFLAAVFRARGVSGSPENHAKVAIKIMEKSRRK